MRICHISSVHPRYDTRIFYKQLHSLTKISKDVFWVVADNKGNESVGSIQIIDVGAYRSRLKRFLITTIKIFNTAKKLNCDIYHIHDPELLIIGLFLRCKGEKVVYDAHEDVPNDILIKTWIYKPLRLFLSFFVEKIENFASRRMTQIITVTPYLVERFKKVNKNTIAIFNYPIKDELFNPSRDEASFNEFCYIGAITRERGIYQLLDCLSFTDGKLRLAGSFENAEIFHNSTNHKNWKSVLYYGFADRNTVKGILNESLAGIVVLMPTKTHMDSYPVKLFEYMSASIPVIASDFPLWKEIIENNECGICVDPLSPKSIANAMNLLVKDKKLANNLGKNGRQAVEKKYNWTNEENKLINIYKSLYHDSDYHNPM